MLPDELAGLLRGRFPELLLARGEVTLTVPRVELLATLEGLRKEGELGFDFLSDVTATDWPGAAPRFWVAYHLLSLRWMHRLRVKVGLAADDPNLPSVTSLFPTANWHEREVFDFFGIAFEGHPDLRRIELPEGWVGHPLRKDHPMGGVNTPYRGAYIPPPDQRGL